MAKGPQVGDRAPDFDLEGTNGPFRLSEHRGERVVLLFYPGDETPVCTKQFCSYRDRGDDMAGLDATVVGISAQDVESHRKFTEHHRLNVPLLADVDKSVAKSYGALRPAGLGTPARRVHRRCRGHRPLPPRPHDRAELPQRRRPRRGAGRRRSAGAGVAPRPTPTAPTVRSPARKRKIGPCTLRRDQVLGRSRRW